MTQKELKRMLRLHSEGVSSQVCTTVLLQTVFGSSDPRVFEAAKKLDIFYTALRSIGDRKEAEEAYKEYTKGDMELLAKKTEERLKKLA